MKRISMLLALSVSAFTGTALMAQMDQYVRAYVPHAAQVGHKMLPAGDYEVHFLRTSNDSPVLKIQSKDAAVFALVSRFTVESGDYTKAELVFMHDDNGYRLIKVIVGDRGFDLE